MGILASGSTVIAAVLLANAGWAQQSQRQGQSDLQPGPRTEEGYFPGADGNRLFYRRLGEGQPVVVYLHGGPMNMNDGGFEIQELARNRTLLMFDMRSGGRSALLGDAKRLGFDRYVADLEALRSHFRLKTMILVGQSFGAMLAAEYTLTHPGVVSRILMWSPGWPAWEFFGPREEKATQFVGPAAAKRLAEISASMPTASASEVVGLCREDVSLYFRFYVVDPQALRRMHGDYCAGTPEAIRHQYLAGDVMYGPNASLAGWDIRPRLPALSVPLLVLEGADSRVPMEATKTWVRLVPNARFLLIPGSGHLLWLEGGRRFFEVSDTFLAGRWPDGAAAIR